MANVSPGVYTKIIDLSSYVAGIPSTIGYLPVLSERGIDNQIIATNSVDYYNDFGEPNINYTSKTFGQGPYVASSFLRESESLNVVRCLPDDASWANLLLTTEASGALGPDGTATISLVSESGLNTQNELETIVDENTNPLNALLFYGVGRGEWYNNFQIKISEHANPQNVGIYILDIYQRQAEDDPVTGSPQFEIIDSYEVSFDYTALDSSGESMYIEDVINRYSRYVKCASNKTALMESVTNSADFALPFNAGPIDLADGSSGSLFDADGKVVREVATQILTQAYNGTLTKTSGDTLYEVLDLDNNYFSIILDGGYPTDVKTAGIYPLVKTRKDCVAIIDNGDNTTVQAALDAREDDHTFNTRYMALYEPYSKIYDSFTGRDLWITPVYHMANIIPYTDNVAELWNAPAGFNRATIATIKELRFSPLIGDRDRFYLNQINPIVKFNVGYTVWGQLTTQKRPSALQDLNIIRLVLYIKRALEQFCKFYTFEMNDNETWSEVSSEVTKFLKVIQNKRGLYSFNVDVGASDYEKKAKKFHVNVVLEPTRVVEQINLNFFIK